LQLFINDAPISYTNVATDKGIIHGLGKVLEIQKNRCDINDTVITVSGSVHTKCLKAHQRHLQSNTAKMYRIPDTVYPSKECMHFPQKVFLPEFKHLLRLL